MELGIDPGKKGETPQLHTLPLELQAMIVIGMAPQHFRKAFFTCRLVCRRLKEATDLAFRNKFVPSLQFAIFLDEVTVARKSGRQIAVHEDASIRGDLDFTSFSEDNTQAILSYVPSCGVDTLDDTVLSDDSEVRFRPLRFWPLRPIFGLLWRGTMERYQVRTTEDGYTKPCLRISGMLFHLPYIDDIKFDPEKVELRIPCVRLAACLFPRQNAFGEQLKLMACQDLEATRWRISIPSVEQGLRIALRSNVVRVERFKTCFEAAYWEYSRQFREEPCQYWALPYTYENSDPLDWYLEWAEYVRISLTTH
ncbi:hypothetical protein F4813DRAFT_350450 [Daldinia decipiens]|uniref:uncharacterized protein n=1 Tax=Daldinia decipiens TaxID=326647 RepID=UPI0020C21F9F|nr:uncharacterized protein F4813DRAFT_350450 [Daldinia decipiens]KAI1660616.1 hypothetical protein F4813DRAFT_350450 [Daldinia decipiens]